MTPIFIVASPGFICLVYIIILQRKDKHSGFSTTAVKTSSNMSFLLVPEKC